jgi:preprotein translocase subunit SecY
MASAAEQLASSINFSAFSKATELKSRIWFTLGALVIYRLGTYIPIPGIDPAILQDVFSRNAGGILGMFDMFSGGALGRMTIFALNIMPYISASIIIQLLTAVSPTLEALKKEGESGRKKLNQYTRLGTVLLAAVQSYGIAVGLEGMHAGAQSAVLDPGLFFRLVTVVTLVCGTVFLMWLGEQITARGVGNGISLIIMAGILHRLPEATSALIWDPTKGEFKRSIFTLGGGNAQDVSFEKLVVLVCLFIAVVVGVIAITKGQRRIPTQSAKHVRGRRVFGGGRQYLPLRVNQAGVMPIIFASSLLMVPLFLFRWLQGATDWGWASGLADAFVRQGYIYNLCYVALIYFFCYFWTAIIFNPKDMANNLKDHGSFIPGYRPGKRTADYMERVMMRITYVGAAFLAIIAIIPSVISALMGIDYRIASFYGGTGLLIVISVALDLVQKINSHLVMRNYPALTED